MEEQHLKIVEGLNKSLHLLLEGKAEVALVALDDLGSSLPADDHCNILIINFRKFIQQYREGAYFIIALAEGNLDYEAPRQNYVVTHYKQLQSNLRHLTWQTQQIARGDYNQRVSYLGEFSVAFNQMTESLREKKMIEERLAELYATQNKFMSIISHDLKSPFNGILGFAELLQQDYDEISDEERRQYIHNIQISAQNAFKLLENLLEWSRIQTGKIQFFAEEVNLSRLVLETFMLLQPVARKKNIHLYSEVPVDATAFTDRNSVLTVIRNLVSNALKFTNPGGKITVRYATTEAFTELSVEDTGLGITPGNLAKLFRMDEKFKTEGTDHEKGTGLGLLLCKEFVEKNGGGIRAESEFGKGSRFIFTIPVTPPDKN